MLFKAAVAFKRSGDPRQAEAVAQLMDRLEKKFPRDGLAIGTRTFSFDDLRQQLDRPAELIGRVGDELVTMRLGNASHTAVGIGGTPFLDPSFTVPMLYRTDGPDKEGKDWVEQNLQAAMKFLDRAKSQVAIPGFFPVTAPNLILYRTYDGVYAVVTKEGFVAHGRTHKAGDMLWMSPARGGLQTLMSGDEQQTVKSWWSTLLVDADAEHPVRERRRPARSATTASSSTSWTTWRSRRRRRCSARTWGVSRTRRGWAARPPPGPAFAAMTEYNRLVAVNIDTGKVEWDLGGLASAVLSDEEEQKTTDTKLLTENAYFLGPPLPVNGKLYVLYERNNQIRLACLDPNKLVPTGPRPRPQAGAGLESEPRRAEHPAQPGLQPPRPAELPRLRRRGRRLPDQLRGGGGGGRQRPEPAVGAVLRHRPGAGRRCSANPAFGCRRVVRRGGMPVQPAGGPLPNDRWRAAAPIIARGKVLFTAYDADHIHCLDLRTGNLLWSDDRQEGRPVRRRGDRRQGDRGRQGVGPRAYTLAGEKGQAQAGLAEPEDRHPVRARRRVQGGHLLPPRGRQPGPEGLDRAAGVGHRRERRPGPVEDLLPPQGRRRRRGRRPPAGPGQPRLPRRDALLPVPGGDQPPSRSSS